MMRISARRSLFLLGALLVLGGYSTLAGAQPLFFDDFEDRVDDQATIGNNWTWYDQWFEGQTCGVNFAGGAGPCDDDGNCFNNYEQDNRNFTNAGADDSYYRAGLEVPAWEGALSNMLRVYGNQYIEADAGHCQRVLIFQELTLTANHVGPMLFSFDVAKDRYGAPANGEITAGFVKVLKTSDFSYEELVFEHVETMLPDNMLTDKRYVQFVVTADMVGELLQFGFYNDVVEDLGQSWSTAAAMYDNVTLDVGGIGPVHSGSWYNAEQSGHGFSMEFGLDFFGDPTAVIYWYTYDSEGNPIFMLGQGTPVGNTVEVAFQSPVGMQYGVFDPNSVTREDGGVGVFVFSDSDNGTFSYTPSQFSDTSWGHTSAIVDLPVIKLFGVTDDAQFDSAQ